MIFHLYFCHQLWVKEYVYILEIVLDKFGKLIHDSRNISGCLTLNEMHIKLTALIICLINHIITNTSLTPPPDGKKKTVLYIAHLINLSTLTETSLYWKFKDIIFNLF